MLALIKLERGELAVALRLMSAAFQARPKSPEVLVNYGLVLNGLGRNDRQALAVFDRVLSIKRRSVEAHTIAVRCWRNLAARRSAEKLRMRACDQVKSRQFALQQRQRAAEIGPSRGGARIPRSSAGDRTRLMSVLIIIAALPWTFSIYRNEEAIATFDRALAIDFKFLRSDK